MTISITFGLAGSLAEKVERYFVEQDSEEKSNQQRKKNFFDDGFEWRHGVAFVVSLRAAALFGGDACAARQRGEQSVSLGDCFGLSPSQ